MNEPYFEGEQFVFNYSIDPGNSRIQKAKYSREEQLIGLPDKDDRIVD